MSKTVIQSDFDLEIIKRNPHYLINKFEQLSQDGKERLMDYFNIILNLEKERREKPILKTEIETKDTIKIIPFPSETGGH